MSRTQTAKKGGKETLYPPLSWIRKNLRHNAHSRTQTKVLEACVVGSRARGTEAATSDLDIALVVPAKKRVSSLRMTENYHANFTHESQKPRWNGTIVDFQFFYPGDPYILHYSRIPIPVRTPQHTAAHPQGRTQARNSKGGRR